MQKIKDVNQGDVLTFKYTDGKYKVLLFISTYKDRSPHNYTFAVLTYDSLEKPMLESIRESEFFGIGNTRNDYFKYDALELNKMWSTHPDIKLYFLGSYGLAIWRKDLIKFRDEVELVGNLNIVDNLDKNGSSGMNASNWSFLQDFFTQKFKTVLADRGQTTFKVKAILRE